MQPNKKAQDKSSVFFHIPFNKTWCKFFLYLNSRSFKWSKTLSFIPLTPKNCFLRDYLLDSIKLLYLILKNTFEYFY
ncbi:hypothetical protein AA971_00815 [Helicobacter pylori]|nr:hypothetical protein AA971_00815 [Helicobacter pylori]